MTSDVRFPNAGGGSMNADRQPFGVLHLIPSDTIGGVEMAAHSLPAGLHGDIAFQKYFMVPDSTQNRRNQADSFGPTASLNSPSVYLAAIRFVLLTKPDLLIASLWRSVLVMIICKLLRPSLRTVVFLHNTSTEHAIDRIANALGMKLAIEIWTDSTATLDARLCPASRRKGKVVSFLLHRRGAFGRADIRPTFIFWGRLRKQKNVARSIALFEKIRVRHPAATFRIIGPDGGEQNRIASEIRTRGLEGAVSMLGPKDPDEIADVAKSASFYLQTSDYEGMAMSVVEAMQFGLVPVVTPVGAIASYCTDGETAVFIRDDAQALAAIDAIIEDPVIARAMAQAAVDVWADVPLYREDVLRLARNLLIGPDPGTGPEAEPMATGGAS